MLRLKIIVSCLFLMIIRVHGQVHEPRSTLGLNLQTFSYPLFLGNEQHKELKLHFDLTENSKVEFQGFYDTYLLENRFRSAIAFKQYVNKNFYALIGAEVEWRQGVSLAPISKPPRYSVSGGFGYDVEDSFSLELKSNFALSKDSMGAFGEPFISMPQVYSIGSKVKF